jgi:prevent-host-death family protein
MKIASITEAKNKLSALIDGLKSGSPVLIVDRGRPVARLEPVDGSQLSDDERLTQLVRDGIVRPARGKLPKSFFTEPLPQAKNGASVLEALLEERREGR